MRVETCPKRQKGHDDGDKLSPIYSMQTEVEGIIGGIYRSNMGMVDNL
jgi:hypothetical protein